MRRTGKVARVIVLGVGGGLIEVVLIESVRETLRVIAHGVGTVYTGGAISGNTKAVVALGRSTDVVELRLDVIGAESGLGNTSQIGDHTAANGVVGSRREAGHS